MRRCRSRTAPGSEASDIEAILLIVDNETTGPRVTAVIVTHRRPRLTGDLVRSLRDVEGIPESRVVVVVSGEGGLDDPVLEGSVRMIRLQDNLGPAAGFRAGIEAAVSEPDAEWLYLCEDDVGLMPLPAPRVADILDRVERFRSDPRVGAIVAYGRRISSLTGNAVNFVPPAGTPYDLATVDVAAWGATLLHREVGVRGILPDPDWFFGFEDFDFFSRVREAGFSVLVDGRSARPVAEFETSVGRANLHAGARPTDSEESWRSYYTSRNFLELSRRHGNWTWFPAHMAYSGRRLQLARSRAERLAILRGLVDGARGRLGINPAYQRDLGETLNARSRQRPTDGPGGSSPGSG
jgi:GT2 family glycosyltransferase